MTGAATPYDLGDGPVGIRSNTSWSGAVSQGTGYPFTVPVFFENQYWRDYSGDLPEYIWAASCEAGAQQVRFTRSVTLPGPLDEVRVAFDADMVAGGAVTNAAPITSFQLFVNDQLVYSAGKEGSSPRAQRRQLAQFFPAGQLQLEVRATKGESATACNSPGNPDLGLLFAIHGSYSTDLQVTDGDADRLLVARDAGPLTGRLAVEVANDGRSIASRVAVSVNFEATLPEGEEAMSVEEIVLEATPRFRGRDATCGESEKNGQFGAVIRCEVGDLEPGDEGLVVVEFAVRWILWENYSVNTTLTATWIAGGILDPDPANNEGRQVFNICDPRYDEDGCVPCPAGAAGPDATASASDECAPPFVIITPSSLDGVNDSRKRRATAALDFANLRDGETSAPQAITILNGGPGRLAITGVRAARHFPVVNDACSKKKGGWRAGEWCTIAVVFRPDAWESFSEEMEIETNAPDSPHHISLWGTGTKGDLPPLSADPLEGMRRVPGAEHPCRAFIGKAEAGWEWVDGPAPREMTGQVVQAHITAADFFRNHYNIDYNWFVYPDPDGRRLLGKGNFEEGDAIARGRIEPEWERANDHEIPEGAGGLPEWAWPALGDRVFMAGNHVWDCGHGGGEQRRTSWRTEIHPPRLVAVYRNAALTPFAGATYRLGSSYDFGKGTTWATRVDIFASSFGGLAIGDLLQEIKPHTWWQRINDRSYSIIIRAPPKPAPGAVLAHAEVLHPIPGAAGSSLGFRQLPSGDGYEVSIPLGDLSGRKDRLQAIGFTVYVGWKPGPSGKMLRPEPTVTRYRVTLNELKVWGALDGDWRLYGYVNEVGANLVDGPVDWSGEAYWTDVTDGRSIETFRRVRPEWPAGTFVVSVVDGQPLHIQFRAINVFPKGYSQNHLAGIVDYILSPGQPPPNGPITRPGLATEPAGDETEDLDERCRGGPCFRLTFTIRKLSGARAPGSGEERIWWAGRR